MSRDLCILVHGFTGSPEELEPLVGPLELAGYDVVVPLLPGHGASKDEMRLATSSQWIHTVMQVAQKEARTRRVHLIGFSMGAMICAIVAKQVPVISLTMLAPAIYYVGPKLMFRQIATVIKNTWNRGDQQYVRDRIEKIAQTPLQSVRQFRRVVQLGISVLPQLTLPVCIIQGEQDEVVEPRGAAFVYNQLASTAKSVHYFPEAGHLICYDAPSEALTDLVLDFLSQNDTPHVK